jgi:Ca2+-binding RTX toxin-like protein
MCNVISGNTTSGMTNSDPALLIAEHNYWGSPTGPTAPSNPSGTGDAAIGNIDFTPWATDPSCTNVFPPGPLVMTEPDPCDPTCTALLVLGSSENDQIEVKLGSVNHPNNYQVTIKNSSGTTTVKGTAGPDPLCRVIVYGLDGDDTIKVDSHGRNIPAWLFGGNGKDKLTGSKGADVLVGEAGNDELNGDNNRDLLIGGTGTDKANGGKGEDIVIGANTDHDTNLDALCAIMDEWTRTDASFSDRVGHLMGTIPGGLNPPYFLNESSIHNDGVKDELTGGSGSDWFIYDSPDKLTDFKANKDIKTEIFV